MTEHLGTPILALNSAGNTHWYGGFGPYGRDWQEGTANDSLAKGIFLRLPGQWDDSIWDELTLGMNTYYNVHRWYETGTGRYTRPDPYGLAVLDPLSEYAYSLQNPLRFVDPKGLVVEIPDDGTRGRYDHMKKCFPIFGHYARSFEQSEKLFSVIPDPKVPLRCGTDSPRFGNREIYIPKGLPDNDKCSECRYLARCFMHEFFEYWQNEFGGATELGASSSANRAAERWESRVPVNRCCSDCCREPLPGGD